MAERIPDEKGCGSVEFRFNRFVVNFFTIFAVTKHHAFQHLKLLVHFRVGDQQPLVLKA